MVLKLFFFYHLFFFEIIETALERMKFLYAGGTDKKGVPVFYLIVARIDTTVLDLKDMSPLVSFVFRLMESVVSKGPV